LTKRSLFYVFVAAFSAHFALASGHNAQAGQDTHLGVPVKDMVTLQMRPGSPSRCFGDDIVMRRISPGLTVSGRPFEVPFGRVLIVTDVEWLAAPPSTELPHTVGGGLSLRISATAGGGVFETLFRSASIPITEANKYAYLGTSEHLTTGFVVGPGVDLCPVAQSRKSPPGASRANIVDDGEVTVRGYLVDNPVPKPRPTVPN